MAKTKSNLIRMLALSEAESRALDTYSAHLAHVLERPVDWRLALRRLILGVLEEIEVAERDLKAEAAARAQEDMPPPVFEFRCIAVPRTAKRKYFILETRAKPRAYVHRYRATNAYLTHRRHLAMRCTLPLAEFLKRELHGKGLPLLITAE